MKKWMRRALLLTLVLTLASFPGWGVSEETELPAEPDTQQEEAAEIVEPTQSAEAPAGSEQEVPTDETEVFTEMPKTIAPEIHVLCEPNVVTELGQPVRLTAAVTDAEGCKLDYRWQYNDGNGYQDANGANGDVCVFEATKELVEADWRVELSYESTEEGGVKGSIELKFRISSDLPEEEPTLVGNDEEPTEVENETEETADGQELLEEEELIPMEEVTSEEEISSEEVTEEEIVLPDEPTVSLSWDARDVMYPDEIVTITATVTNAEYYDLTFQWQCNLGNGFEDVPGAAGETYSFPATAELLSAQWQVLVHYELKVD